MRIVAYAQVLSLLDGGKASGIVSNSGKSVTAVSSVQIPDLIDTRESDDFLKADGPTEMLNDQVIANVPAASPFTHDLLGDSLGPSGNSTEQKNEEDPFADVSFHSGESNAQAADLFSGMNFDDKQSSDDNQVAANGPEPFDIFGSGGTLKSSQENSKTDVNDLLAGMSISEGVKQQVSSPSIQFEGTTSNLGNYQSQQVSNDGLKNMVGGSQLGMMNGSTMFPSAMQYGMPPGMMLNPALAGQSIPVNYGAMGGFLTQQQLVAAMSNLQQLSNLNAHNNNSHGNASQANGSSSALPDIFHPSFPNQTPTSTMSSSKKEESKAFDFITVSCNLKTLDSRAPLFKDVVMF
ncbi:Protein MODIFIED TRANSPORT TO THE VACUOLE 1 [Linum grandiflorum]